MDELLLRINAESWSLFCGGVMFLILAGICFRGDAMFLGERSEPSIVFGALYAVAGCAALFWSWIALA